MRGGARKGSGRPPIPPQDKLVTKSFSLPQWAIDKIDEQSRNLGGNKSKALCALLTTANTLSAR